jgi:CzcA family heavy metal efflux pump
LEDDRRGILTEIIRFSLQHRGTIIALSALLLFYGLYTLRSAKYDVFPEFVPPEVTIRVEAPGFSPEQVEELVTRPVEYAIMGVQGIESLLSSSIQGLSAITVKFRAGTDVYLARQMVGESMATLAGQLPQGVVPFMTPLTSSTAAVLQLGLASDKRSLMEIRTVADWTVKPRLLAASGVAQVQVFGGEVKQLQVQMHPERLTRYDLSMDDLLAVARKATGIRGAGFIDTENQRIILQSEGQSTLPDQLARAVLLHRNGAHITLGDVANVAEAPEPPVGEGAVNGRPGVVVLVSAQYGANTLEVTRSLDQAIRELRPALDKEGIILYPDLFRPADFIHTAIYNVVSALQIGAILVVIILLLFLFNYRTAAISFTAIPLSLITAITLLVHLGFTLNTMVLSGLAIAIGEVVDDAVIDVENIFRRLRENRHLKNPRGILRVALEASIEVRSAVVFATFSVLLIFIPILTLPGLAGRLFAPLGIAYILAVLASLVVALTVTPVLSLLLLGRQDLPEKDPPVVRWSKGRYQRLLLGAEKHPRWVVGSTICLVAVGLVILPFLHSEFLPQLREADFIVHMTAVPGTSLEESQRLGSRVTFELLKIPSVRVVSQKAGRAKEGSSTRGTNMSEIDANLKPPAVFSPSEVRKVLAQFPGLEFAVKTFLTERIDETISGYTASVVINLFGNDLNVLDQKGQEIARTLRKVPGAVDIQVQSVPGTPQITIRLRKEALAHWGFDPVAVLDVIRTAYQGSIVGQVYEGNRVFDVSVMLNPQDRKAVSIIGRLPMRNSTGTCISLRELADIYETSGRYVILHNGARRVQTVTCNVEGRSSSSFVADAKRQIRSAVSLPAGTYIEFTGTAEAEARSRRDLLVRSSLASVGIILLLSMVVGHYRNVLLILLNLPFALVGGVLAVLASGGLISLGAMVGFVTVFGITLRSSIMMFSHYEHLVSVEGMRWGPEAARRGASERLAPILMTALVTAFGLLPLAIGSKSAGREIEGPMAIVILGGLITSTALNLLVLPTLALRYGRFGEKVKEKGDHLED